MKFLKNIFVMNTLSLYCMNVFRLLLPLLTIPYLARIFSTDIYGVVVYIKALMTYIQLFIDFGFLLSATKDIAITNDKVKIGKIVGDTLIEKMILSFLVCILFFFVSLYLPIVKNNFEFVLISLAATLSNIFILDFLFRGLEKMHLVAIPFCIAKTFATILIFIVIRSDGDLLKLSLLDLISNILAILLSWYYKNKNSIRLSISNWHKWIYDLKFSFVFFLSNFATTIFGAFTTIITGIYLNTTLVAYWGLCMQMLSAAKALYSPITNSLYTREIKHKDIKLVKKIGRVMAIPMAMGTYILLSHSDFLMRIIGGDKYLNAGLYLKLLLPAFIFSFYSMLFGWPVLGAIKQYKLTTLTTILAALFQLLCMIILMVFDEFKLNLLAIICSLSEFILFVSRYYIYYVKRSFFKS